MADPPGYRDWTGKPLQLPTLYGSPLTMLKAVGKFSRDDVGEGTGLPYKATKEELITDWRRRWADLEREHPEAYPYFVDEVPKDALERLDRAHDMGNRVPASRGMHQNELGSDAGFSERELRKAMGQDYSPIATWRMGRHAGLGDRLISPAASHFGVGEDRAVVPLLINAHPNSTLVTTDTEANDPYSLSSRLKDEGMMPEKDMDHVFDNNNPAEHATRMRRWLTDNGYTTLLYPNEAEGAPRTDTDQHRVMSTMGVRAGQYLNRMPFYQRSEAMGDIPNPSMVVLDPANIRHQMANFDTRLAKKIGYKLGVPLAGGMAGLKYLQGSKAEAGDFMMGGDDSLTKAPTGFVKDPYAGQSIQPYDIDEWYNTYTDGADDWLSSKSETVRDANDSMQTSPWWGSGMAETLLDIGAIPVNGVAMFKNRMAEGRVEDAITANAKSTLDNPMSSPEDVDAANKMLKAVRDRGMKRSYTTEPVGPVRDFFAHDDRSIVSKPAEFVGGALVGEAIGRVGINAGKQVFKGAQKYGKRLFNKRPVLRSTLPDVEGWRFGNAPEGGKSWDARNDDYEKGLSMMETSDGESHLRDADLELFEGIPKRYFKGAKLDSSGADGEPLMTATKPISRLGYHARKGMRTLSERAEKRFGRIVELAVDAFED